MLELANPVRTHKIPSVALWLALCDHVKNPCVVGVQPDEVRRPDGSAAATVRTHPYVRSILHRTVAATQPLFTNHEYHLTTCLAPLHITMD